MAHDIFISYSNRDSATAESICNLLEQDGLRCWIAPRDITPGVKYAAALVDAITNCRVFILVLSTASNESPQVEMEVDRAASKNIPILCFRIDDVVLSKTLEYYLSSRHWLDASRPPLEAHIRNLSRTARDLVKGSGSRSSLQEERSLVLAGRVLDEEKLWESPLLVVTRGKEQPQGRAVLVTRIRSRMVPAGDFLARFELLAESIARVEPGHLAQIVDHGEEDGRAVVLEAAPAGRRLAELVGDGKGLPQADVLELARQLGETLTALYKKNLVQLVFDPRSIWVDDAGRAVVSQAGIPQGANLPRLLSTHRLEPDPYHAPELRRGEPGERCTDFYSLGALLYFALTGRPPEAGASEALENRTPAPGEVSPGRWRRDLVPEWDDLVSRCLQPSPARRIQSVAEYFSKLEEVRHGLALAGEGAAGVREDSLVGQVLGGYQLVEKLGQGGMATVYKAYESALDRYVAVKVLPAFLAGDDSFAQRFRREARAVAHLSHPNIIPVYNFGEDKGIPYIAMQLMQGGTLKRLNGPAYSPEQALRLLLPVTRALAYAHQRGIVHRDIKPNNILLTEEGWPVIADFGLVQMAEASARLTTSGVGLGTPAYMSPEQGQGGRVDQRSDIYSLGIVLYEMVTGDVPFHATTPVGVLFKHATEPLPPVRKVSPGITGEIESIILKAAAKDPQDRYQDAAEMAAAMEEALGAITSPAVESKGKRQPAQKLEKPARVEVGKPTRKAEAGKAAAGRKPPRLHRPAWKVKPWIPIVGVVAVLVIAMAGIFAPRLFTGSGKPAPTGTAYAGYVPTGTLELGAPPTTTAGSPQSSRVYWDKIAGLEEVYPDQVNAILVDPNLPQIIYAGTQNSGIYKSMDGGANWAPSWEGLAGASIGSLAIQPRSSSTLFAGVYASGLYRSRDGGATWQLRQPNINLYAPECANAVMDPGIPERLYYSDGKNLFLTEDSGESWTLVENNLSGQGLCKMAISNWDNRDMYGVLIDGGFYMSTDRGRTWNSWEPWAGQFPGAKFSGYAVWIDPYESNSMYVSFIDAFDANKKSHLLHSVDRGSTWTDLKVACSAMAFLTDVQGVEYCVDGTSLSITRDNGQQWEVIQPNPDAVLYSLALASPNMDNLYLGSWGVYHMKGGSGWETLNKGLGAFRLEFMQNPASPDTLFLQQGSEDLLAQVYKDTKAWNLFGGSQGYQFYSFDNYGSIYGSVNTELWKYNEQGGFNKIASLESYKRLRFIFHPYKLDVVFGTGDPGVLYRSGDNGSNWEKLPVYLAGAGRLFFTQMDPETILSTAQDRISISHDLGSTWEACESLGEMPDTATAIAIDDRSQDRESLRIYLATRGSGLAISSDNCKTWARLYENFRSPYINSIVLDPLDPDIVYVGTDAGVYRSRNRGENYEEISLDLPGRATVYSLSVRGDGTLYAATPFGVFQLNWK